VSLCGMYDVCSCGGGFDSTVCIISWCYTLSAIAQLRERGLRMADVVGGLWIVGAMMLCGLEWGRF